RVLVDTLPVGVLESTVGGRIVSVNGAWRRMFGFGDTEDLTTVNVRDLYGDAEERSAILVQASSGLLAAEAETVFRRRDGTLFPAERYSISVVDAEGKMVGLRGVVIDVTNRKNLEAQLNQAQKMKAIGQLTGGIAHDFNNILMVIIGSVDALQEEENLGPGVREQVDQIDKSVQRATDLTRSLLAFSHKLPLHPQPTDMNDLVVTTGKLLRRTLGAAIEIDSVFGDDLWPVQVDRGQLETALLNLCINARDAMPGGGRLLIETSNARSDDSYLVKNAGAEPGDFAILSITDTGTGIPAAILDRVFDPFFTTKDVGKGTGLGLSMVHGFIKQSNGHIRIKSEVGHGTSIIMYLPRSVTVQAEARGQDASPLPRGGERILVVEDETQVREVVIQQLVSLGYAVTSAADGAAGLAVFEAAQRPYDLLLTDIIVPGPLNGKALADEVTRRWPKTRVLFMSGYSENALTHNGHLVPGAQLLSKPFRKTDLAQAIRRVLDNPTS
ncbi:MAG: ATP-binding protein, partial [bacterium]|nr:ATP-binding protein [bacterium]